MESWDKMYWAKIDSVQREKIYEGNIDIDGGQCVKKGKKDSVQCGKLLRTKCMWQK